MTEKEYQIFSMLFDMHDLDEKTKLTVFFSNSVENNSSVKDIINIIETYAHTISKIQSIILMGTEFMDTILLAKFIQAMKANAVPVTLYTENSLREIPAIIIQNVEGIKTRLNFENEKFFLKNAEGDLEKVY